MCRALTVSCLEYKHTYTFSDHIIPCKQPYSAACLARIAELHNFQNPSTTCVGTATDHGRDCEACEETCKLALKKYGESIWVGPRKRSWVAKWLGSDSGTVTQEDWVERLEEAHSSRNGMVGDGLLTRKESDGALEALRRMRKTCRGSKE